MEKGTTNFWLCFRRVTERYLMIELLIDLDERKVAEKQLLPISYKQEGEFNNIITDVEDKFLMYDFVSEDEIGVETERILQDSVRVIQGLIGDFKIVEDKIVIESSLDQDVENSLDNAYDVVDYLVSGNDNCSLMVNAGIIKDSALVENTLFYSVSLDRYKENELAKLTILYDTLEDSIEVKSVQPFILSDDDFEELDTELTETEIAYIIKSISHQIQIQAIILNSILLI